MLDQDHENWRVYQRAEEVQLDVLKRFCKKVLQNEFAADAAALAVAAFDRFRPLAVGTLVVVEHPCTPTRKWLSIISIGSAST